MADTTDKPMLWYSWLTELVTLSQESHYIMRVISWFFITLSLLLIVPVILLVAYDLMLWLWRLAFSRNESIRRRGSVFSAEVDVGPAKPSSHGGVSKDSHGHIKVD